MSERGNKVQAIEKEPWGHLL